MIDVAARLAELDRVVHAQTDPKWAISLWLDGIIALCRDAECEGQTAEVVAALRDLRPSSQPAPSADFALPEGEAHADGVQRVRE